MLVMSRDTSELCTGFIHLGAILSRCLGTLSAHESVAHSPGHYSCSVDVHCVTCDNVRFRHRAHSLWKGDQDQLFDIEQ